MTGTGCARRRQKGGVTPLHGCAREVLFSASCSCLPAPPPAPPPPVPPPRPRPTACREPAPPRTRPGHAWSSIRLDARNLVSWHGPRTVLSFHWRERALFKVLAHRGEEKERRVSREPTPIVTTVKNIGTTSQFDRHTLYTRLES